MELQHVCDLEFHPVDLLRPGAVGGGRATGERIRGALRWRSAEGRPSDDVTRFAGEGVIATDDGVEIALTVRLMALPRMHGGGSFGDLVLLDFETSDERYAWLTRLHAVAEEPQRLPDGTVRFEVFAGANEVEREG